MESWQRLRQSVRNKSISLGPGSHSFLKSLSLVTLCFSLSKVFSSAATVIMARYLGPAGFGEAQVILLVAQFLSLFMLFGLPIAVIRYGAAEERPESVISTSLYLAGFTTVVSAWIFWLARDLVGRWIDLSDVKVQWALQLGLLFAIYTMLTSIYQARSEFKRRGIIEMVFAALLLPGLGLGHLLTGRSYQSLLIAYSAAYILCLPPMIWRFRRLFSPAYLFAPQTKEMLSYGCLALLSNTGYILTFLVQPLQLQHAHGEADVGLFRLYCAGSVNLATFATTIFYTVFFPKVSASKDRQGIWRRLNTAWVRAALPLIVVFAGIQVTTVSLSGGQFPLWWNQVILFAIASTLITITTTYGQVLTAQGVRGMRWGLIISVVSGMTNYLLSAALIPHFGITGAALALIANYTLALAGAFAVRNTVLNAPDPSPDPAP